ncbi:MAG: class I SAM-dependent methyltransferase [Lachnospiraceae bacterium]|nr:class I SAM-dependent methyltransferase [Lachnospiraceae bacterium]
MAELNLKYYNNVDSYSDGDVEVDILNFVKEGLNVTQIPKNKRNYACAYHLSAWRENIINWYPLKKTDRVLEIGAGCGAVTGALCRNAGSVVSVELSKHRAEINYERHKDYDNLEIMVGNLNDMDFNGGFDYVILIGVFEYAMSYTKGEKPYETFLNKIKSFVKPGGKILMAIENRLGEKYFAGAYEDHTDAFFLGLNEYKDNTSVRTFSKQELTDIFHNCEMNRVKFYYPYPDYKFPSEIYTDETINSASYGREYMNLYPTRYSLYNEKSVSDALVKEGIMQSFANSFFVEAVVGERVGQEEQLLYAKMNCGRKEEFRIATIIYQGEEKYVIKKPLNEKSVPHIERVAIKSRMNNIEELLNLPGKYKDGVIRYEFLEDENLDTKISRMMDEGKTAQIVDTIREIQKILQEHSEEVNYHTEEFEKIFGDNKMEAEKTRTVCPANIDCICDNIICRKDGYVIIDGEWIFDMPVPVDFIVWRLVNELYTQHGNRLQKLVTRAGMYEKLNILPTACEVYETWAKNFAEKYVGGNELAEYGADVKTLELRELVNIAESRKGMECALFYDTGNGFSAADCCKEYLKINGGEFTMDFTLDKYATIKNLRFDPLEGKGCKVQITKINGQSLTGDEILGNNAEFEKNDIQIFISGDPQYFINPSLPKEGKITISGKIKVMPEEETMSFYRKKLNELETIKNSTEYKLLKKAKLIKNKRKE